MRSAAEHRARLARDFQRFPSQARARRAHGIRGACALSSRHLVAARQGADGSPSSSSLALSRSSPSLPVDLPQAIVTGFESVYSYRRATPEQAGAIDAVLAELDHPLLTPDFLSQPFAALTAGEQSLILLLRALVKRPPLLVLDEPFSGMDKLTVDKAQRFLDDKLDSTQAVILITHFEEEVPRSVNRVLRLDEGAVVERI